MGLLIELLLNIWYLVLLIMDNLLLFLAVAAFAYGLITLAKFHLEYRFAEDKGLSRLDNIPGERETHDNQD